tara:strand:+ start:1504 stop:2388 length:885 start_codon:yes stop_codon:yes gene_type:complete
MARTTRPVSTDYDFPVGIEPLLTADGKDSGWKCTRRLDTGKVLEPVTKDYGLVRYSDHIGLVEEAFGKAGLMDWTRSVRVVRDGARMYGRYDFPHRTLQLPKVGDELGLRLTINNSYDRSCKISFAVGMVRLVCTNGMTSLDKEFEMNKRHTQAVTLDFIGEALDNALGAFDNLAGDNNIFTRMAEKEVKQDDGLAILMNLTNRKVISEKVRENIARVWNNPSHEADSERNLYNLLNATTQHLTHGVEEERFELSEKLNRRVTRIFTNAANSGKKFAALVEVPKKEEEVLTITE